MAEPPSIDLRKRVIEAIKGGMSRRRPATHFQFGVSSAIRFSAQSEASADLRPKPMGGDRRSGAIEAQAETILSLLAEKPDRTLAEFQAGLAEKGFRFSVSTIWRFFARQGITLKKVGARFRAGKAGHPEAPRGLGGKPTGSRPEKLVCIDETWASTNVACRHGRAACGERLGAAVPYGHWKTTTFVARLRLDRVVAPLVLDGPINAQAFEAYVEQFLAPTLRPGDIVIMDNFASHKRPRVSALIEAVGAKLLSLPPYSPDLNPIEKLFAKLKALLRKGAERTVKGLWQAIGESLDHFSPRTEPICEPSGHWQHEALFLPIA
jgi:transposase